ncbi:MAG: YitT family protein [Acutalibacteraceae bacterium]
MAKAKKIIFEILCLFAGSCLCSISINMFASPNNITQGGLTGIALILKEFIPSLPIGTAIFIMNIPLFILAKIFLQKGFLLKTFINTAVFTVFIDLGQLFIVPYRGDRLLSCLFCGVLTGTGLALVFLNGGTTGGTDILAMLIKKASRRLSTGRVILIVDLCIVGLSFIVYREIEAVLYALIAIFLSSKMIDTLLYGTGHGKLILIVTEKGEIIKQRLFSSLNRGVTTLSAKGGYTGDGKSLLLCAARVSEIKNINNIISSADENAFTVICDAGEIIGRGFND